MSKLHKWIIGIELMIVICATVQADTFNRVQFMDDKIDQKDCYERMSFISDEYFEGIRKIRIYDKEVVKQRIYITGRYYWCTGVIDIYYGCDINSIIHELAHHQQCINNNRVLKEDMHASDFHIIMEQIQDEYHENIINTYSINNTYSAPSFNYSIRN